MGSTRGTRVLVLRSVPGGDGPCVRGPGALASTPEHIESLNTTIGAILRFLHTSDWHLGVTMQGASCEEEQALFLDWLIETIKEKSIDVLIVAGDIFHRDQPPARVL